MSDCPQWVQFKRPCGLGGRRWLGYESRTELPVASRGRPGRPLCVIMARRRRADPGDGAVIEVCCLAVIGHLYKRGPSGRRRPK